MKWTSEVTDPTVRKWEEFYRNRFQHDKRVRTTHGVNCTGSCSWEVFVKDGIVTWELQATEQLLKAPAIHVDETSFRVDKKNHWIHVYSSMMKMVTSSSKMTILTA